MSTRPLHPCNVPGCAYLTTTKYCTAHEGRADLERAEYEAARPQAQDRGYGVRWRKYREVFLDRHPYCADPFLRHVGSNVPATQVDHIIPHKGDQRLFWDQRNHQALCVSCGGYKSAVEQGGRAHSERKHRGLPPASGVHGIE
jgi:5-methylcytosine-specific restriction enzyme A